VGVVADTIPQTISTSYGDDEQTVPPDSLQSDSSSQGPPSNVTFAPTPTPRRFSTKRGWERVDVKTRERPEENANSRLDIDAYMAHSVRPSNHQNVSRERIKLHRSESESVGTVRFFSRERKTLFTLLRLSESLSRHMTHGHLH
jgi:hypothetical protein